MLNIKLLMMTDKAKKEIFLELLEPEWRQLSGYARALTGNTEDARDLVSDTLLSAFENFDKLKNYDAFKSYIFTIARRKFKRNKWRMRIFTGYDEANVFDFESKDSQPDVRADVNILFAAMQQLPDKQREAIALFEISGLSLQEIQKVQGGTLSGVKTRLRRARQTLAEILGEKEASRHPRHNGGSKKNVISNIDIKSKAQINLK